MDITRVHWNEDEEEEEISSPVTKVGTVYIADSSINEEVSNNEDTSEEESSEEESSEEKTQEEETEEQEIAGLVMLVSTKVNRVEMGEDEDDDDEDLVEIQGTKRFKYE
jgi:hypothetical protein